MEQAGRERLGVLHLTPRGRVREEAGGDQVPPDLVLVDLGAAEVAEGAGEGDAHDDPARLGGPDAHDRDLRRAHRTDRRRGGGVGGAQQCRGQRGVGVHDLAQLLRRRVGLPDKLHRAHVRDRERRDADQRAHGGAPRNDTPKDSAPHPGVSARLAGFRRARAGSQPAVSASASSSATWRGRRPVKCPICWRQETPVTSTSASRGAASTAGKSERAPIARETS